MPTIDAVRRDHVTLEVACRDRLSRKGYGPPLQMAGQLLPLLTQPRGQPIPAPTLLPPLREACVQAPNAFAAAQQGPILPGARGVRKEAVAAAQRARCTAAAGGVVIGLAPEQAHAFRASQRTTGTVVPVPDARPPVPVNSDDGSRLDAAGGPAFIPVCTNAPVPLTVYLTGPAWPTRHLAQAGSADEPVAHGVRACAAPIRRQAVGDTRRPDPSQACGAPGRARPPRPLTEADRRAGSDARRAIWPLEGRRTQGCAAPAQGRAGFAAVSREHRALGRPARIHRGGARRVQQTVKANAILDLAHIP